METIDPIGFAIRRLLELLAPYDKETGTKKQIELATRAGVDQGTISKWIDGLKAGKVPKLPGLLALTRGLEVSIGEIFPAPEEMAQLTAQRVQEAPKDSTLSHDPARAASTANLGGDIEALLTRVPKATAEHVLTLLAEIRSELAPFLPKDTGKKR